MIKVVGVGPGSEEFMTSAAKASIDEAEVLVGGDRLLDSFATNGQETYAIKNNLAEAVEFIKDKRKTRQVVVLASGDPGMYGILNFLLRHFQPEELEVIPGVSSVQLACARLRISWHDAIITSVHGRDLGNLIDLIKGNQKVIILTDNKLTPAAVAQKLLEQGIDNVQAWVCQNLSYPNELVRQFNLEELKNSSGYPGSVMVITR